jgi:hypothetical protein
MYAISHVKVIQERDQNMWCEELKTNKETNSGVDGYCKALSNCCRYTTERLTLKTIYVFSILPLTQFLLLFLIPTCFNDRL